MTAAATHDRRITRFWLVRHGEPRAEIRNRCYGRLDAGLSELGRKQLEQVARDLATKDFAAIYSSPRLRARESAEIIALPHQCAVQVHEQFHEIDFGDFEGMSYDEIARRYPVEYQQWMSHPTEVQFPNGESFSTMQRRVLSAAQDLLATHAGETIAVVTHGGVNRILLAQALSLSEVNLFRIGQGYAARNLIQQVDDCLSVELMNQLPELR
jgi:alpha-ribazole phosphatase